MAERIYVGTKTDQRDALGEKIRARIMHDLDIATVNSIRTAAVYAIDAPDLSVAELTTIAQGPLSDRVIQSYTINSTICDNFDWMVEVGFRPGVTDNAGRTAKEAVAVVLGERVPGEFSVHTGIQYFFLGNLSRKQVEHIAQEVLANHLIQTISVYSRDEWLAVHTTQFEVPQVRDTRPATLVRTYDLSGSDADLMTISSAGMLALSLDEMKAVRSYYERADVKELRTVQKLPPMPTDVELEIFAQTWSEHCKHKIFAARIEYIDEKGEHHSIRSLFKQYIQAATETVRAARGADDICLSVFKDNAGVITFNDKWAVVFKVETHNSPSALDPYGGALTGIVGVNRDSFATGLGCRLIANTDVFCFASPMYDKPIPPRILHPRRVFEGVREGVEHGGNKSGIPTVNGCVVFDDRFLGKPLVYCGTVALMPRLLNGHPTHIKKALPADHIVMVGGRIGKDGIHGATFSSEALHEGSPVTAVQIGDPITQKRATDFLLRARDKGLYSSITDNGAGGLSSSVGEMATDTGGAVVHLDRAPLKYQGLLPWEIFVSEAQERMTLSVPPQKVEEFLQLAAEWNVEASDLGEFNDSGYLTLLYDGAVVASIEMAFLHDGLPPMHLTARWRSAPVMTPTPIKSANLRDDMLGMLKRLNICSKEFVVRQYDHEVQGGSVVKPLCGVKNDGPSDAGVFRPDLSTFDGVVISNGIVPRYSDIDAGAMSCAAFDEAVRNAVCVGADPDHMAALDNFCWCDPVVSADNPDGEYKLAQLVRANMSLYDMCVAYGIALISGKDSMKNDYRIGNTKISIPPTLLVSIIAKIDDVRKAVTMDLKKVGSRIYLLGTTGPDLGASEYAEFKELKGYPVPTVTAPAKSIAMYRSLYKAIGAGLVATAHDLSDGGLGIALVEMCFSGELAARIDLGAVVATGCKTNAEVLFSESQSRILVEVTPEHVAAFEAAMAGHIFAPIGETLRGDQIECRGIDKKEAFKLSRIDAKSAWKSTLGKF